MVSRKVLLALAVTGVVAAGVLGLGTATQADPPACGASAHSGKDAQSGSPGPVHAAWAMLAGEYKSSVRFIMPTGEQPPASSGKAKVSSMLGGRFVVLDEEGEMFGQAFAARKTFGFNAAAGTYESHWVYTGSTAMMTLTGASADDGKTVTYEASYRSSAKETAVHTVTFRRLSDDSFSVLLSGNGPDGKPGPSLESVYTRVK